MHTRTRNPFRFVSGVRLVFVLLCPALLMAYTWLAAASQPVVQTNCAPRPNGLVAWYRGEGNGLDSIGTNHGTVKTGVGFTTGKVMQAFDFNGTGEVSVPNAPALNPARLTIETWVYPTLVDGSVDIIVNKDSEPYDGYQYEIGIRGPSLPAGSIPIGNFAFALRGVNGLPNDYSFWVNGGGAVPLNTWTHVAVTYDGAVANAYINGVLTRSVAGLSGDITPSAGPLKIGSRSEDVLSRLPNERFNGRIDEVSLYNRALTAAEILAIFQSDSVGKCPVQNTPPTITAGAALTRQQGNPGAAATIATVNDLETPVANLSVTATTVPTGLAISNINNTNGTITATVTAGCNATAGAQTVILTVTDAAGGTATANLTINVTANSAPTLGPYPTTTVNLGQSVTITPSAAPADNNTVASVTAAISAGFTGTVSVNASTGVVSINNAAPGGAYVVTVTATDNCGASTNSPFNLTVGKLNSATQLMISAEPYLVGQAITLAAKVTATGAGAPTGAVMFLDGATSLGQGTLNASGVATFTTSTLTAGTHKLTAAYAGDTNYGSSTSAEVTILIARPLANVSAASYLHDQFAREEIVAAFGINLATTSQAATNLPLPTTLAGTAVRVTDSLGVERLAQLFFVSANQVNYLLPAGTALGPATVKIANDSNPNNVAQEVIQIATVAPGVFTANANGSGVAAAQVLRIQPSGAFQFEPVARLDAATQRFVPIPLEFGPPAEQLYLLLYGTGFRFRAALNNVTATVGGISVPLNFAGAQGSLAGLDQANLLLPQQLAARGEVEVVLTVDGKQANIVRIGFR
ncbi:MAG: Ig-like domain repeat protein [Acidobacteria bacterium]|nr:Ig-like domain repeat protein [Acidobacteriota bacterium]MBI3426700.1 Ig-like domain repeat protein [Acidobacteriota bacterium]